MPHCLLMMKGVARTTCGDLPACFLLTSASSKFPGTSLKILVLAGEHMLRNEALLLLLNVLTEWFFFFHENATFCECVRARM